MRGYPAWPAKVLEQRNDGKYSVIFFGTLETANVQPTDIWPYDTPNSTKFCTEKNMAKTLFMEGMEQMKQALAKDGGNSMDKDEADTMKVGRSESKKAADDFIGSSEGLKRKLMGAKEAESQREKRTRRMTFKMLESPFIRKDTKRKSGGYKVEMKGGMTDKRGAATVEEEPEKGKANKLKKSEGEGGAIVEAVQKTRNVEGVAIDVRQSRRRWSVEDPLERNGHLDESIEASLMDSGEESSTESEDGLSAFKTGPVEVQRNPGSNRLQQIECDWDEEEMEVSFKPSRSVRLGESALLPILGEERGSEESSDLRREEEESDSGTSNALVDESFEGSVLGDGTSKANLITKAKEGSKEIGAKKSVKVKGGRKKKGKGPSKFGTASFMSEESSSEEEVEQVKGLQEKREEAINVMESQVEASQVESANSANVGKEPGLSSATKVGREQQSNDSLSVTVDSGTRPASSALSGPASRAGAVPTTSSLRRTQASTGPTAVARSSVEPATESSKTGTVPKVPSFTQERAASATKPKSSTTTVTSTTVPSNLSEEESLNYEEKEEGGGDNEGNGGSVLSGKSHVHVPGLLEAVMKKFHNGKSDTALTTEERPKPRNLKENALTPEALDLLQVSNN